MIVLSIIALLVLISVLFYHRVNLYLSSLILLVYTAALSASQLWSFWVLLPLVIMLLPLILTPLRKSLFSAPALRIFRSVMPAMSRTEKKRSMQGLPGGKVICSEGLLTGKIT